MAQRYLRHQVGLQSAALAFYLLFAIFPFLIFISALLGLLQLNTQAILDSVRELLPEEVVRFAGVYLRYVSANPSPRLLAFGLLFSIWFPMRATNTLLRSVRAAYHLGPPRGVVGHTVKTFLCSVLLIITVALTATLMTVSDRILTYAVKHFHLPSFAAELWARLRFPLSALVGGAVLFFLYATAQDGRERLGNLLPGTVSSLGAWMCLSWLYAWYVNNIAQYSLLYGSIGTVIVLLTWLNMSAQTMILGAELNGTLMDLRRERQSGTETEV